MKRYATIEWNGDESGSGKITSQSGALKNLPYSFHTRFEDEEGKSGTNPEELIASAHASCFNMALALMLSEAGYSPNSLKTRGTVSLEKEDGGYAIKKSLLSLDAHVSDIDKEEFQEIANKAKDGCPVSNILNCEIELEAVLK